MKTLNRLFLLMIVCGAVATAGCTNTASGMHQDWRSNMQSIANSTGN